MSHLYSASKNAFFHAGIHAADRIPEDAVPISAHRHQQLLTGQAEGRRISAGKDGKPQLSPKVKPTAALLRRIATSDIKREARRRIFAIATLERQANDNAAIAAFALDVATGNISSTSAAARESLAAPLARRAGIDTIRVASNQLEAAIATWSAGALEHFNAADAANWPKEQER